MRDARSATMAPMWKLSLAALVLLLLSRRKSKRPSHAKLDAAQQAFEVKYAPKPKVPEHGLRLTESSLEIVDWNKWMRFADRQIRRAVAEGALTPSHVAARIFYAMFPDEYWPPDSDSPLCAQYDAIVATLEENLDEALRPIRIELAKRQGGLRLVD